jgi:hypothetical protein
MSWVFAPNSGKPVLWEVFVLHSSLFVSEKKNCACKMMMNGF